MKYCKFISQVKSSQVKSSAKIISLIALFILLFSISCKSKQNPEEPPEETYNSLIPKEFSGKYILSERDVRYDYSDYFETTSSNFIIHSKGNYTKPIVLNDANANNSSSINGKSIVYYEDTTSSGGRYTYTFYTNSNKKRVIIIDFTTNPGWWNFYVHADDIDDINK